MSSGRTYRSAAILTGTAIASVLVGAASAWIMTSPQLGSTFIPNVSNGPWQSSPVLGAETADPWTRAFVSRVGLLALPRQEVIYFTAKTDSQGEPLRSNATYRIEGPVPDVGWWSLTAYGEDDFLMPSDGAYYSVNSASMPASDLDIHVGPDPDGADGLWIETSGEQSIALSFRFYRHPGWSDDDMTRLPLPSIIKATP